MTTYSSVSQLSPRSFKVAKLAALLQIKHSSTLVANCSKLVIRASTTEDIVRSSVSTKLTSFKPASTATLLLETRDTLLFTSRALLFAFPFFPLLDTPRLASSPYPSKDASAEPTPHKKTQLLASDTLPSFFPLPLPPSHSLASLSHPLTTYNPLSPTLAPFALAPSSLKARICPLFNDSFKSKYSPRTTVSGAYAINSLSRRVMVVSPS